jgi:hypothetical protein
MFESYSCRRVAVSRAFGGDVDYAREIAALLG